MRHNEQVDSSPENEGPRWSDQLRDRGLRATSARLLVFEALANLTHGTPEEVHHYVASRSPGINLSTVYRTLELLASRGVVSHTHLGHASTTYMLVEHAHHGHLVCHVCGIVIELDGASARNLVDQVRVAHCFILDTGHISLFGLCENALMTKGVSPAWLTGR